METTDYETTTQDTSQISTQKRTRVTKFLDAVDGIDRKFYGKRIKLFVWGCFLVLIVAPILDEFVFEKMMQSYPDNLLTFFSTLAFLTFVVILILAFVGSWRDDEGAWTWKRAKSRLQTYYEISKDQISETRTTSKDENLYRLGQFLFFGAIGWKAFQNLSVFVRKPIEALFGTRLNSLRHFELFTKHYYWIVLFAGVGIIAYLYKQNPKIYERVKNELRQLFGWDSSDKAKYPKQVIKIETRNGVDLVINTKRDEHINSVIATSKSNLFNDFVTALQNWNPNGAYYEYEFKDRLIVHLRKSMPAATIESEFPFEDLQVPIGVNGRKKRGDVVINQTILVEMKRNVGSGEVQRAQGQISNYSSIWKDNGPVILLLCDYDYDKAKVNFTQTMNDLAQLQRPALTIVAT